MCVPIAVSAVSSRLKKKDEHIERIRLRRAEILESKAIDGKIKAEERNKRAAQVCANANANTKNNKRWLEQHLLQQPMLPRTFMC